MHQKHVRGVCSAHDNERHNGNIRAKKVDGREIVGTVNEMAAHM